MKRSEALCNDGVLDLRLETLSRDLLDVICLTQEKLAWAELPGLVLIGHSLGGAVVTDLAMSGELGDALLGYAVLDVVEGIHFRTFCLLHLSSMLRSLPLITKARLRHRRPPKHAILPLHPTQILSLHLIRHRMAVSAPFTLFPSRFSHSPTNSTPSTRSRTIRNTTSARISVPSLLRQDLDPQGTPDAAKSWIWRTDLASTQPFWEGWFAGLSKKFLEAKGGKLLLLAGTDRLDKELMIGQMQGLSSELPSPLVYVPHHLHHHLQKDTPELTEI